MIGGCASVTRRQTIAFNTMLTSIETKAHDFDDRCQIVAADLWYGRSVVMTEQQLRFYNVTPHKVIEALAYWLKSEESEACWEERNLYRGHRDEKTWIVYCTKRADKYVFKAKIK